MNEIATLNGKTFVDWLDEREEAKRNLEMGARGAKLHLNAVNDTLNRMISGERDE